MSAPFSRISITLPRPVLAAADRLAKRLDRSRSWVVAEALRRFVEAEQPRPGLETVREPGRPADAASEVAAGRLRHLQADLARSPAERLHAAEELARLAHWRKPPGRRLQIVGFDSYEEFYEWKTGRRAGA
jgi:hypothetical protein